MKDEKMVKLVELLYKLYVIYIYIRTYTICGYNIIS